MGLRTFLSLLLLLLIGLKLAGSIAWSWWWVLSPMWAPFALALLCGVVSYTLEVLDGLR